ncbi:Tc5 transposase DNA-binding domain [Popillia japonica]|uniref:Tc5 transposase DNA-binding domain n=1 Tax=Popillia japonica TaxID=7064 RepID=A0AAW1ICN0_POPJA
MAAKRPHTTLIIREKIAILDRLEKGESATSLAQCYWVGKSTITDIKRNKNRLRNFARTESGPGKRKTLRQPEYPHMENALHTWFLQQRLKNAPISGSLLAEKAKFFFKEMVQTGVEPNYEFQASVGWLDHFKKRHGIRHLKITGEKLSNNKAAGEPFRMLFRQKISEMGLCS